MTSVSFDQFTAAPQEVPLPGQGPAPGGPLKPPLPPDMLVHSAPQTKTASFTDFTGKAPGAKPLEPSEPESSHFLKRAGKDIAGLADMVLSAPGGLLSTMVGKAYETFEPLPLNKQEAARQQAEGAHLREVVADWTTSPIAKLMHVMGYKGDYSDADVGKVTKLVNGALAKGSDHVSAASHGVVSSQQLQVLAGDLMNLAPLGFSRFALAERARLSPEEIRSGKIGNKTAEGILNRYTEKTGNAEGLSEHDVARRMEQTLTTKSDAEINAEAKAYDLLKRGASLREVQAARKANPLIGEKLDKFMDARRAMISKYQPVGPHANYANVDEILGPERKVPTPEGKALPGSENGPATGTVSPGGQSPMGGAPTPPRPELPGSRSRLAAPEPAVPRGSRPGKSQSGSVDMRTLLPLAGVAAGAFVGAQAADREKLEGAILGGFTGLAATILPRYAGRIGENWKKALTVGGTTTALTVGLSKLDKDHPVEGALLGLAWGAMHFLPKAKIPKIGNMTIDELVNTRNGAIAAQEREISNVSHAMRTTVPETVRREAVAAAVEAGSTRGLSPAEVKVYNAYKGFTKSFGEAAKDQGVLKDLVQNYVTHVVERDALPGTKIQEVMDALFGGGERASGGASAKSGFAKHRKYASFEELEKALEGSGLSVKTKDIADLVDIYGRSMSRAIENKKMFDALKLAKEGGEGGIPFIVEAEKAPMSYEPIRNPQLQGMRVHPDLAPALKFVAESYRPGYITRGILGLSLAQKRLATGMSLFHAQNLINAYVGATGVRSVKMFGDINAALKAYREGGLGDVIDTGLKNGLRIERPMETDLAASKKLGGALDSLVNSTLGTKFSGFEKGLGGVEKLQRETFDKLTWDYLHSGLKLALFTREFEKGLRNHPTWSKDEVARQVASFTNDTFGGLDWYRVATETRSQIARQIALHALSPTGRGALQILMFAPDWTMSTFRAMYKALPGSGAMPLTQRLHMKYVMRTALIWATLMNGLNIMASGHSIWDNKDPTKIEWRDGTTQQIAKHAMEGPEWLLNPRQTALNKLGRPIAEVMDQLLGVEYMSASGKSPPMQESRAGHLAKAILPLSVQTGASPTRSLGETAKRSVLSTLGMPVYRMTKAEKEAAKRSKERTRRRKTRQYGSAQ